MFDQFINHLVEKASIKTKLGEQYMLAFAQGPDVYFVKSDLMYRLYTMYMGDDKKVTSRKRFYQLCGYYLYYERFVCRHGDEYYYYVKFNTESDFYKSHAWLIKKLILANDPSSLTDYIGTKDLTIYNKNLKGV